MKLHENISIYSEAVRFTSQQMNLKPEYIEKDYWVTYALFTIFHDEIGEDVVFKGGTALSKCFHMIDRFSEDIDLVVVRRDGETDSKLKSKLKAISSSLTSVMPEVDVEGITRKKGMNRKTAHQYAKSFSGNYGQVRDVILLESSWLGHSEPYRKMPIVSFVGNMMIQNGQISIAEENGLLPFKLQVLEPIRTICEKIMSLVRFSYSEEPLEDLKKKIRHTYDLHQLLKQQEFELFFQSSDFDDMLLKVAKDDMVSFRNNNAWLAYHPNEALLFKELDNVWAELKAVYTNEFSNLVYGDLPDEKEVLETLKMIRDRMNTISWNI